MSLNKPCLINLIFFVGESYSFESTLCFFLSTNDTFYTELYIKLEETILNEIFSRNFICCIYLAFYFYIISTMHGQNHIKNINCNLYS
jgi:hypothetical protein